MSDQDTAKTTHKLKTEEELIKEYERLSGHLAVFWMYRPRNKALKGAFPATVWGLKRRVEFLEEILQIPEREQFDYEKYDQIES